MTERVFAAYLEARMRAVDERERQALDRMVAEFEHLGRGLGVTEENIISALAYLEARVA